MQNYMGSPESPMNLGSPTSAAAGATSPAAAHYLPGYLLGDYPSIGHSPAHLNVNRSWLGGGGGSSQPGMPGSPPKALHLSSIGSNQFASPHHSTFPTGRSPGRASIGGGGGSVTGMHLLPSPSVVGRKDYKPGAPPTVGLFDHMQTSPPPSTLHQPSSSSAAVSFSAASRLGGADGDSFYGETTFNATAPLEGDEFWVTIFGFPPAAASYILQQFSQFGNIMKHVIAPNGNWMHLQYQSKIQAQKALSKNGRVFGNNIMVGVAECTDQSVTSSSISGLNNNENALGASTSFASPSLVNSSLALGSASATASPAFNASVSRTRSMRTLTSSSILNSSVRDDRDVVNDANTPKKSSGLISKTVDYLFGW